MSKPSRGPNRERRPKRKRDRELKRQIEELPVVVTIYDEEGIAYEFNLDCGRPAGGELPLLLTLAFSSSGDGCWAAGGMPDCGRRSCLADRYESRLRTSLAE
ncbi:MAG: hypothetical protein OEV40_09680 [Acidimicrobiia bacterium]|nr:hypothetical protein [Acidimicrobiia bacterium]